VCAGIRGLERDRARSFRRTLVVASCAQQRVGQVGAVGERIELLRSADERYGFIEAAQPTTESAIQVIRVRVARAQLDRGAERGFRARCVQPAADWVVGARTPSSSRA
jgi:hypothetical protein